MKLQISKIGVVLSKIQQRSIVGGFGAPDCRPFNCCDNNEDCEKPTMDPDPNGGRPVCEDGSCVTLQM